MEIEPYALLIRPNKAKIAVLAWLRMLGRFGRLCLPSLCHSTLHEACRHINVRYSHHAQPYPRGITNLNCTITSCSFKTVSFYFQLSQVCTVSVIRKQREILTNTHVNNYLECYS